MNPKKFHVLEIFFRNLHSYIVSEL